MSNELVRAETWMYGVLAGDTTLANLVTTNNIKRIGLHPLPAEVAAYPLVTFQLQSSTDHRAVGNLRTWITALYLVQGIDQTADRAGTLKTIADRIDALLHRASWQSAGSDGTLIACLREGSFAQTENDEGRRYERLGGFYRVEVQVP